MTKTKQIESIALDRLIAHPENPNRMAGATFNKLAAHIERSGNYEPIIVRKHPKQKGCFEILNGHHRAKALNKLGAGSADCVVWDVDDDQARILLATLNRLGGSDQLGEKSELIKKLAARFSTKDLARQLPDTAKAIERLKDLARPAGIVNLKSKAFLNAMVFFLTDEQKQIVDEVIAEAVDPGQKATAAQKRAWALVTILRKAKR